MGRTRQDMRTHYIFMILKIKQSDTPWQMSDFAVFPLENAHIQANSVRYFLYPKLTSLLSISFRFSVHRTRYIHYHAIRYSSIFDFYWWCKRECRMFGRCLYWNLVEMCPIWHKFRYVPLLFPLLNVSRTFAWFDLIWVKFIEQL